MNHRIPCLVSLGLLCAGHGAAAADESAIKVLDPGRGARHPLRYKMASPQAETLVLELASAVELTIGDMKPPMVYSPLLRFTIQLQARKGASAGIYLLRGNISQVDALPTSKTTAAVVSAVNDDVQPIVGTVFTASLNASGLLTDLKVGIEADATPQVATTGAQLEQALHEIVVPFPDQPVGKGARWEQHRAARVGNMKVDRTLQYQLTQLGGRKMTVTIKVAETAAEQTLTVAGLPPLANVELKSFEASGGGSARLELNKVANIILIKTNGKAQGTAQGGVESPAPMTMSTTVFSSTRASLVRRR